MARDDQDVESVDGSADFISCAMFPNSPKYSIKFMVAEDTDDLCLTALGAQMDV